MKAIHHCFYLKIIPISFGQFKIISYLCTTKPIKDKTMDKKYELIPSDVKGLYRVKALRDFSNVKKGDIGGYVESEKNLSQEGNCWVYDNAKVFGNAKVSCNAKVCDNAIVSGNATVSCNAQVYGNAWISGNSEVYCDAKVYGNAKVWSNATVSCNAQVYGNAWISGNSEVKGKAKVYGDAKVYNDAVVYYNAKVFGNATVGGNAVVCDNAEVCGDAEVFGEAKICGDAVVESNADYIIFKNFWSSGRFFTWTRSNNMWKVGCFYGSGEELIKKAYKDSEVSGRNYEAVVKYVESLKNLK